MPQLAAPDLTTLRCSFIVGGVSRVCHPRTENGASLTLSRDPGEGAAAGAFYYRSKLTKALLFYGNDYKLLLAVEQSTDRCQYVGLLLETRPHPYAAWQHEAQFRFTCNDCEWNYDAGTASVNPIPDDGYQGLLDNYEQECNLLLTPGPRQTVHAQLQVLAAGISIEFMRVGRSDMPLFVGIEGWALFIENKSWIYPGFTKLGMRETNNILFRYRLRNIPLPPGSLVPPNKTDAGWEPLLTSFDPNSGVVDYVKTPSLAKFRNYLIGTYNDWNDPKNPSSFSKYDAQLLVLGAFPEMPSTYGYDDKDYIEVTGKDGFGANNAECQLNGVPAYMNLRRNMDDNNCKRIFWRFGNFQFGRCFPLLDGLYSLLNQTTARYGGAAIVPPTSQFLSSFFTNDLNQATGDTGAANEIPRLLLSAGSDVKYFGATEAATRLLVSLKQMLADLSALYDVGWFIDPVTGWFRIEHRAYLDAARSTGSVLNLTSVPLAQLPRAYTYRVGLLPRYEDLMIANASSENLATGTYFAQATIDYGISGCVTTRQGGNRTTVTSTRLTGDVAAGILFADSMPDNAIFLLAPDIASNLPDANRRVAATQLQLRYYTYGRATYSATVEGPAQPLAANTVATVLPVYGKQLLVQSVRPQREQGNLSAGLCTLRGLDGTTRITTSLGTGAQLGRAELDLGTGVVKLTAWLTVPGSLIPGPVITPYIFQVPFVHPQFS